MEVDEGSAQKSDIFFHWMVAHARLKNEFTEDEMCQNLMTWLILFRSVELVNRTHLKQFILRMIDLAYTLARMQKYTALLSSQHNEKKYY